MIAFFGEQFKKSHENLKKIILQSHVSDLDKNKRSKFYYCYTGQAISASFVEHFYEIQQNTLCVYFAVVIWMVMRILHLKQILLGNMNSYFYVDSNVDSYPR